MFSSDIACESNITLLFSPPKPWGLLFYSLALCPGSWGGQNLQLAGGCQRAVAAEDSVSTGNGVG